MSWDKRATTRRQGTGEPDRKAGMYIVYLGVAGRGAAPSSGDQSTLRMGDAFRLLPGAAITFGRSDLCEVTVRSERVSTAHALITFMPGTDPQLVLIDLGSESGTWVDDRSAPLHFLGPGAEFAIAKEFRFRCQPAG